MIVLMLADLAAAEPDRWPGYAAWVVEFVRAGGGTVEHDRVIVGPELHARLTAAVAERQPQPFTPARIAHGFVGLVKAVTGTGGSTAETVAARLAKCTACPNASRIAGTLIQCRLCGCSTWAKLRNAGEQCPDGRWGPQA